MKETDYGKKVGRSLAAIAKMHSQTAHLMVDCDKLFPDYKSVFENYGTRDLSYSYNAGFWMAEGIYRYWCREEKSIAGLTVGFYEKKGKLDEPIIIVGAIKYGNFDFQRPKENFDPWFLWYTVLLWQKDGIKYNQLLTYSPEGDEYIESVDYIIMPLFWIQSLADVQGLFEKCGAEVAEDVK